MSILQALETVAQKNKQRAELRALLQAANTPVSDADINARMMQELDASAFPLDTEQGQIINPKLAALIASGMGQAMPEQASSDPLAGIPIGIDTPAPAGVAPQFPQNRNLLRDAISAGAFSSPLEMMQGIGQLLTEDNLRSGFSKLNDAMVASTNPAVKPTGPVKGNFVPDMRQAVEAEPVGGMAPPNQLDALIAVLGDSASPVGAQPTDMTAMLSADTAKPQGFLDKLGTAFQSPYMQEMLLQTGLGLAQSQSLGQALAGGVEKGRAAQAAADNAPLEQKKQQLAFRKFESDLNKTDAETGKLSAETLKLLKDLDSGSEAMSETDYAKVFTDMQKHVSSDVFRMAEDSPFKLDSETYARYLTNSGLKPESRRYGPLKAEYGDLMSTIWNDVETGKVKQSVLDSRLDEFEVAFGPQQTARLILKLQGK